MHFYRGGTFGGYCDPATVKGVCCIFATSNCAKPITQKISYFTNKSFPRNDLKPYQCLLSIESSKDICWVCDKPRIWSRSP